MSNQPTPISVIDEEPPRSGDASRSRWRSALFIVVTIALGLASRVWRKHLPPVVGEYAGDTLYAMMIFWLAGFVFPSLSTRRVVARAFVVCILIEVSQLYQADWINAIRHTRVGGLVLGFGFLWSDLACYACGILIAGSFDRWSFPGGALQRNEGRLASNPDSLRM